MAAERWWVSMNKSGCFITFTTICLALVLAARAQEAPTAAKMDRAIQSYVSDKQFMGTVLVSRDTKIVLDKAYGAANLEWGVPNTPTTKFRIGSITKQFTAAAILPLEERGSLNLADALKKYLPYTPSSWDAILLRDLLTHTSGIFDITDLPDFDSRIKRQHLTAEQSLALVMDRPLDFPPGQRFHYSSSGYLALGAVIEKVSGKSYSQFLQENFFDPLGMKETGYDDAAAIMQDRASGYELTNGAYKNADFIDMSVPFSADALYSSTHDLLIWETALFGGRVLSAARLKEMTTPYKDNYGFGLSIRSANGHLVVDHGGDIDGFSSMLATYPNDGITIVVLGNVATQAPFHISDDLAKIAFGSGVQPRSDNN